MKIRIEYPAVLQIPSAASGSDIGLPEGASISDLLTQLEISPEHQRFVASFVNGVRKHASCPLKNEDKVYLSIPMGGG